MYKAFIDTNILVYSLDKRDLVKQNKCRAVIRKLAENNLGVISTQVLQEFFVTATKKLSMDPLQTKSILSSFENFEIVTLNSNLIKDAIDILILNKLSFWDSLLIAAASSSKCAKLYSEDFQHGANIRGVEIINPLVAD